eukprot:TRINITY_DN719_c0_g1_i7.p1 TRINITY_DN719_c0_g1~~TRINITY_DN719_c0_g1_i7.p1  ORF type:complete len:109 (-),score=27.19 TRINITY_DN719_c0_g1_i7:143-469(-)
MRVRTMMSMPHLHVHVAVRDEEIIGCATLVLEQKLIHDFSTVGHVEDVVVSDTARKLGIGKKLLDALYEDAKQCNCYKVILDCKDELVPFYEKAGYQAKERQMRKDVV